MGWSKRQTEGWNPTDPILKYKGFLKAFMLLTKI